MVNGRRRIEYALYAARDDPVPIGQFLYMWRPIPHIQMKEYQYSKMIHADTVIVINCVLAVTHISRSTNYRVRVQLQL